MVAPSVDQLRHAWTGRAATRGVGEADGRHRAALGLLADGRPVSAERIAASTGQTVDEAVAWLARMAAAGYELDQQGRLVGAALTLRPTHHHLRVRGHDLYAWCGFDTLFLPLLLDEPVEVASTCPVTGRPIHLAVAADGHLTHAQPDTTVVAIVGPEVLEGCATTGPGSAVCTQMPLFADREAGDRWLQGRPGVAIVDLATAASVARDYAEHGCGR